MRYAYFPGCALESSAAEYGDSAQIVAGRMGIDLVEIPDWTCCGATPAHITQHDLSIALPIANCTFAERENLDIVTCCAACFHRLLLANKEYKENPELSKRIRFVLEEEYEGRPKVKHLLQVFRDTVGVDALKSKVTRELTSLTAVCYYGCLLTRAPKDLRIDSAEEPTILDTVLTAVGVRTVAWTHKTECCGATLGVVYKKSARRLVRDIVLAARAAAADCIAVACPLCQANLDLLQSDSFRKDNRDLRIPIIYFTQLIGLALGENISRLYLNKLVTDPGPLLRKKGIIKETW